MDIALPAGFEKRMREQLGSGFGAYLECLKSPCLGGLRVNTQKLEPAEFGRIFPYPLRRIPWAGNGYFYPDGAQPAKHPYYHAGLYYLQEPSAMAPAALLPVVPGDRVLDLCAAPGGKSTELAARLKGEGLLVSNDISSSRAKALLKNIELFGVKNAVVASESPARLAGRFKGYFDKILVDAPCSGEGMFRKSPAIRKNWEQYGPSYYNGLQRQILPEAVKMLKPGGFLLYSTCTFSPLENEGTVQFLLDQYPELEVVPALPKEAPGGVDYTGVEPGRPEWARWGEGTASRRPGSATLSNTVRFWPHKIQGEGHFIALLQKSKDAPDTPDGGKTCHGARLPKEAEAFLAQIGFPIDRGRLVEREGRLFLPPLGLPDLAGLRILRSGLFLGESKKNRFEPSQALANALKKTEYGNCHSFLPEDPDLARYLKCETVTCGHTGKDGFVLVCAGEYPVGWAKANNGGLKNKYLPGWRML